MSVPADQRDVGEGRFFDLAQSAETRPSPNGAPASSSSLGAAMRRRPLFVLTPVIVLLALALLVGIARTPSYTASTRLAVGGLNATNPASLSGFADAAQQLAQTYSRSVRGDGVVGEVAQQTERSRGEVRSHLSASPIPETAVFSVEASADSSDGAIQLSNLAAEALVAEVEAANRANPTRLLDEYRAAELERQRLGDRVEGLAETGGPELAKAQAELLATEAQSTSLRNAYGVSQEAGTVPLQVIQKADSASGDGLSTLQLLAFVAVVVGLVIGMALALFRDSPSYEGTTAAIGRHSSRLSSKVSSRLSGGRESARQRKPDARTARVQRAAGRRAVRRTRAK